MKMTNLEVFNSKFVNGSHQFSEIVHVRKVTYTQTVLDGQIFSEKFLTSRSHAVYLK